MRWEKFIIDFNQGPQIIAPPASPRIKWKIIDRSGEIKTQSGIIETDIDHWTCKKCNYMYFVPWRIELEDDNGERFIHDLDVTGQPVLIDISPAAIGDSVAWMPAVEEFSKKWKCNTIVCMKPEQICLYRDSYPDIRFITPDEAENIKAKDTYARYRLAVWGYEYSKFFERVDFRKNNLQRHADMILGVDSSGRPPRIDGDAINHESQTVFIAARASRKCKEWNNPGAWDIVVSELTSAGYKVVCIDADDCNLPSGAIDKTGKHISLVDRARDLKGGALFIGLPSGLSWIAWACGIPVVLISGFTDVVRPNEKTMRYPEFDTPYRVSPPSGSCRNCWMNCDQRENMRFDECYYEKRNECTRSISPEMVLNACMKAIKGR